MSKKDEIEERRKVENLIYWKWIWSKKEKRKKREVWKGGFRIKIRNKDGCMNKEK